MATNAWMGLAGILLCIASTQSSGATIESHVTTITFGASAGTQQPAPTVRWTPVLYVRAHLGQATIGTLEVKNNDDYLVAGAQICMKRTGGDYFVESGRIKFKHMQSRTSPWGKDNLATVVTHMEDTNGNWIPAVEGSSMCTSQTGRTTTVKWVYDGLENSNGRSLFGTEHSLSLVVWISTR